MEVVSWSPSGRGLQHSTRGLALHKAFKIVLVEMLFVSWESSDCKQSFQNHSRQNLRETEQKLELEAKFSFRVERVCEL